MELFAYEKEHLRQLRDSLAECTVLLKKNGDFPLAEPCRIAAYGCGVRHTVKGGTGSGEVNSRFFVNVEEGLKNAGFEITTGSWLEGYEQIRAEAKAQFIRDIKARAKKKHTNAVMEGMGAVMPEPEYDLPLDGEGEAAIYVLSRISGEGNDRQVQKGDILLTETEKRDILALNKKYKKFLLVLNVGGPVDLQEVNSVSNILLLSQLGVDTGTVLADILLGKVSPSGKLTTTWAAWGDYCREGEFGDQNDTRYREGIYVGYRYFDTLGKTPLYPFGYGLSYGEFTLTPGEVSVDGETVTVNARVANTGSFPGKEVVQAYVSVPSGKLDQPCKTLAGFAKTGALAPGAEETVSISFRMSELASYDTERSAYILEAGSYVLRLGTGSADARAVAALKLEQEVITCKTRSIGGKPDFADWKPEKKMAVLPENLPLIPVDASQIPTETVAYDVPGEIDKALESLTNSQLAYLNVGAFDPKGGIGSIIGNAAISVSGAAGETSSILKDQGFPALVMADGPAGLRLSPQFYRDEKGVHAAGQAGMPESLLDYMSPVQKFVMRLLSKSGKPKAGVKIEYQYATAIPIGTALAQSWNLELARNCGDIVGDEMERFGVHLWLAPALNIHRSIRCGRNFEYFSEDPLISGKFAAAITQGVQKHPGCGTTIKHFAANNQETNRYTNNSQVSERALREIYLRGFGVCVRESQPCAVMTSYNLLNGEHTSERRDLIEDYLRSENGYRGIVMTDWIMSAMPTEKGSTYRTPMASRIAGAGGDLVMPGGKEDYADICKALDSGTLTAEQLRINATRLYRMARKLAGTR